MFSWQCLVVGTRRHLESLKKFPKAVIVGGLLAVVSGPGPWSVVGAP